MAKVCPTAEGIIRRVELESDLEDLDALVSSCRSYRRFDDADPVGAEFLVTLVDLARRSASAMNRQPLRFHVTVGSEECRLVRDNVRWAGALRDWDGPTETESPTGFVSILATTPTDDLMAIDCGIAAQTMALAASQAGYGCCMFRSFPKTLAGRLVDDTGLELLLVMAFGRPAERVVLDEVGDEHGTTYWRDADDVHHVPKRSLADVLV